MAKLILNPAFDAELSGNDTKGKYQFIAEEGAEPIDCVVWIEKSKKSEAHPDGKPWIKLPKGNITNREYFSEDLFLKDSVDGEIEVPVKTTPHRTLNGSGVRQDVVKYLSEDVAKEYTEMVNRAVEKYKAAKNNKKKKMEEMSVEELEQLISCLKAGTKYEAAAGPKSFMDMFTDEEYERYNEILAIAQENKANAPKVKRGPMSEAEKKARAAKRAANELSKAEKLLAALQAVSGNNVSEDEEKYDEEEYEDVEYEDLDELDDAEIDEE